MKNTKLQNYLYLTSPIAAVLASTFLALLMFSNTTTSIKTPGDQPAIDQALKVGIEANQISASPTPVAETSPKNSTPATKSSKPKPLRAARFHGNLSSITSPCLQS